MVALQAADCAAALAILALAIRLESMPRAAASAAVVVMYEGTLHVVDAKPDAVRFYERYGFSSAPPFAQPSC